MRLALIILSLLPVALAPGCTLHVRSYEVNVQASVAERQTIFYWLDENANAARPFPDGARIVVIRYHLWPDDSGHCEVLDTTSIPAEGGRLHYPSRLYWAFGGPGGWEWPQYPGIIAFAENCWPTCVDPVNDTVSFEDYKAERWAGSPPSIMRLVFWPRSFSFDKWAAEGAGLHGDYRQALTIILRDHLRDLRRSIEASRDISPAQRAMVFRQLVDLVEASEQSKTEPRLPFSATGMTAELRAAAAQAESSLGPRPATQRSD